MRFYSLFVLACLCCVLSDHAIATDVLPAQNQDSILSESAIPEGVATVEADHLEGKKGKLIEATGNAFLQRKDQSIRADRLLYFQDTQDIHAQGSVVFIKGEESVQTDRLWYFDDTRDIDAQGSVLLDQGGSTVSGPHLRLNLDTSAGSMEDPEFFLQENGGRGSATVIRFQDQSHFTLDDASYTTCPAGNRDWTLNMAALEIDKTRQIGVAHHAWIEFMNVPILYSPWMDFPLNDQRKSGFLAPIFGGTVAGGSELTLPFYWNIAPNRDATLSPRFMMKRGLMLNNEFRYLEPRYGGELEVDVIPHDKLVNLQRNQISLKHRQDFMPRLQGNISVTHVSDDNYFRDLSNAVNATSQVNLLQEGTLDYHANWGIATARVQRFQTLQDPVAPIVAPYKRLPQLTLASQKRHARTNLSFAGEFVDFKHPSLPNGRRLVLNPSVSYSLLDDPAFFVIPKIALHRTQYVMGAYNTEDFANSSRTLPILSVDSGMVMERGFSWFGNEYLQQLEPRAFYVRIPYRDQDRLPNFDSAAADFNLVQIFSENRFSGSDRVGDANQFTLALTSRLLEQFNGKERLKVTIGQRYSFSSPKVNLNTPSTTLNKSDVLMAASGHVTDTWLLDSEIQYDPNQTHIQRYNISTQYHPEAGKSLNLGYRFLRNTLRQVDVSTQWPLSNRWHAVGRWNYSLEDARILEVITGLEYNQSCWALRLVAQRFTTATQQSNISFFVQLELNDMVKMGSDPLDVLKQSVPGYSKLNENSVRAP